jgi:hypothetical protein
MYIAMKKNLLMMSMALLFCIGCNSNKPTETVIHFNREDAALQIDLHDPDTIVFGDLLNPTAFHVMYDTLVIVQNQSNCDYLLEMYSLLSKTQIAEFAQKGGGPDDFVSCSGFVHSATDSLIYLIDQQKNMYYVINVPASLASGKLSIRQRFQYNSEIHPYSDISIVDSEHYIGYNMWYLNSLEYSNNVPALKRYSINQEYQYDNPNPMEKYDYFVAAVNEGHLLTNPVNKDIWFLDGHQDKIDIYNDSLKIIKTLSGPDGNNLSYTYVKNVVSVVAFENNKRYRAYTNYTYTNKHIYVIYEGAGKGNFNPKDLQPIEVLKFDWDGNLICVYNLDHFVYAISVDSEEKYLYCTTRLSIEGEAHLVRYKL